MPEDTLEELASLPTLAHPTASPDGSEVAFYYDVSGRNELHVLDVETGEHEQWTDGEVPRSARWFVEWAADGDRVYFHRDEDGNEQNDVYAVDRDGDVEAVVEMDGQVSIADVPEDGETLLVGGTRDGQRNLYSHDLDSGETTKLTDYERAVYGAAVSPDGDRIAYATNETDVYENVDAYVADADGSNARVLEVGETGAETAPVDWGPDGRRLLIADNSDDVTRPGIYDLETDEVTWFGGEHVESPQLFLPDGERFVAVRTREAAKMPVAYDAETGESRELDLPEGVAGFGMMGGEAVLGDDRLLLTHTTPTRRPDLLAYDLADDDAETLVEAEYGPFEPSDFADAEYVTFESDGVPETPQAAVEHDPYETLEIGGLFFDSGERPSPLIVNPHGGPRAQDTKSFDLYTQFLVQQGYSVVQVNYRGSAGRGLSFARALYDDWGGAEQGDVLTGAEHVLEAHDFLDEDRVAVFGGSYGGYSAYWQLVQYPEFYDAGVAWIGLTHLERMYEDTMPHFKTELMEKNIGTPEEAPDLYRERSPIEHVENLRAPICILHGVNDRRVPVSQARLFRDALEERGWEEGEDFEYHELGEEGHASSDIDQKVRTFRLLDDYLSEQLDRPAATADDD